MVSFNLLTLAFAGSALAQGVTTTITMTGDLVFLPPSGTNLPPALSHSVSLSQPSPGSTGGIRDSVTLTPSSSTPSVTVITIVSTASPFPSSGFTVQTSIPVNSTTVMTVTVPGGNGTTTVDLSPSTKKPTIFITTTASGTVTKSADSSASAPSLQPTNGGATAATAGVLGVVGAVMVGVFA